MKTLQETLKTIDRTRLINEMFEYNHLPLYEFEKKVDKKISIGDFIERFKKCYNNFIDRLISLQPQADDIGIFFVHEKYDTTFDNNEYCLVYRDEVLEHGEKVQSYAFEFIKQEEIAGYLISDAKTTQDNLYELLAYILNEASFFGFENERLDEEKKKLEESIKEIEEGKAKLIDAKELFNEFDMDFEEEDDEEKDSAIKQCVQAIHNYNQIFFKREVNNIIEQLKG